MVDLKQNYAEIKEKCDQKVLEVLANGYYIGGPDVKEFEEKIAQYANTNFAISCGNGTDALQIAMMALDIKPQDEIITTPFTFIATAETIRILGAKPVFVDIDPKTYNIDPAKIEAAITPKTKCIIPVHLYGQAADMAEIMKIAKKHNLKVIEDNAQGLGGKYKDKKLGSIADISTISFYPAKNLGACGDGGMILTNDEDLQKKLRMIANHGQSKRYYHSLKGVNSRLDALQAAILSIKLDYLDSWNKKRREIAKYYSKELNKIVTTPFEAEENYHIYHQYTILAENREELRNYLADNKIPSAIHYPIPLHLQEAFLDLKYQAGDFEIAERIASKVLSLPMHPNLTPKEMEYIVATIKKFYE